MIFYTHWVRMKANHFRSRENASIFQEKLENPLLEKFFF